jgi:hypothetical protein
MLPWGRGEGEHLKQGQWVATHIRALNSKNSFKGTVSRDGLGF